MLGSGTALAGLIALLMSASTQTAEAARAPLSPVERYALTERALRELGALPEDSSRDLSEWFELTLPPLDERASPKDWEARAAQLFFRDADGGSEVFELVRADGGVALRAYRDRQSKQVVDFELALPAIRDGGSGAFSTLSRSSRLRSPGSPLRIAIDPGHMGGDLWDERTGKFIRESRAPGARKLSEGVLALQTALLLERELLAQGHEVMLTRRTLAPVSELALEDLPLREWGLRALRQKSWMPWFTALLPAYAERGVVAFQHEPAYQRLFQEPQRLAYFLSGEDLVARVREIEAFGPDVTLIIHYDVSVPKAPGSDPNGLSETGYNGTKVYVPGGVFGDELATREDRAYVALQGLQAERFEQSVQLARGLVEEVSRSLSIPPDSNDMNNSMQIADGVYARNLHLTRKITQGAIAYIETLFYNAPREFEALSDLQGEGAQFVRIGETETRASARLVEVARAFGRAIETWRLSR